MSESFPPIRAVTRGPGFHWFGYYDKLQFDPSGRYILGPTVKSFEAALAEFCRSRHAVALSSGTDALLVALMALDIQAGDEVIVPAFSFFASAGVVARLGAVPVLVDIEPETYLIDREGYVLRKYVGAEDWTRPEIINYLSSLL